MLTLWREACDKSILPFASFLLQADPFHPLPRGSDTSVRAVLYHHKFYMPFHPNPGHARDQPRDPQTQDTSYSSHCTRPLTTTVSLAQAMSERLGVFSRPFRPIKTESDYPVPGRLLGMSVTWPHGQARSSPVSRPSLSHYLTVQVEELLHQNILEQAQSKIYLNCLFEVSK